MSHWWPESAWEVGQQGWSAEQEKVDWDGQDWQQGEQRGWDSRDPWYQSPEVQVPELEDEGGLANFLQDANLLENASKTALLAEIQQLREDINAVKAAAAATDTETLVSGLRAEVKELRAELQEFRRLSFRDVGKDAKEVEERVKALE